MFLLFRFITACETYRFWSFDENFGLSHFVLPFLQVHMSKQDFWIKIYVKYLQAFN
jgi:hypothetical protein